MNNDDRQQTAASAAVEAASEASGLVAGEEEMSPVRRWIIAGSVVFGAILSVLDVSVVNVALPHMMGTFGRTLSEITWVATSYSIAEILMATMAGWWSAILGRKRLYIGSFVLFSVGSALCGTAQSFTAILVYRTIQGLGGGTLIPISMAILRETFPPRQQAMAMALYGMGVVLAPAFGPVLGGWLTDAYGWPWIFYINLPLSAVGILMVSIFLKDPPYLRRGVARIDWAGIAALSVGLTGLQVVLERGQEYNWFESSGIVIGTAVTVMSLGFLVWWELRTDEPVVNLRLLRNLPLGAGCLIGFLFGIALYGSTFLLPAFLQTLLGYGAYDAGMVLLPRALTLFVMMPVAGWLYNRIDPRILIAVGIAIIFMSFRGLSHLSLDMGFWNLVPILVIMGTGMPFLFVTLTTVAVSTISRRSMTDASSLYTLSRRVGGNVGYSLLATVIDRRAFFHRVRLAGHLSVTNPALLAAHSGAVGLAAAHGLPAAAAGVAADGLIGRLLYRQAGVMAYSDAAWVIGAVFLVTLPLLFVFPGRAVLEKMQRRVAAESVAEE